MNFDDFKLPTQDRVREACRHFDDDPECKIVEPALSDLFARYPNNTNESEVLLKVVTLNDLYSTRIPARAAALPNVFDVARCIPKLGIDKGFEECSLEIVNTISNTQFPPKKKIARFSFASKYASWHRPEIYPMWDGNVQNYLTCLRKLHQSEWDRFAEGFKPNGDWGYAEYQPLMTRLRAHFGLAEISFKDLDKFLWWHGLSTSASSSAAAGYG